MGNVQAQSLKHRAWSISSIQVSFHTWYGGRTVHISFNSRGTTRCRHQAIPHRGHCGSAVVSRNRPVPLPLWPWAVARLASHPRKPTASQIDWATTLTRFRQCLRPKSLMSRSRPAITVSLASWSGFRGERQTDCTVRFSATCSNCLSSVNPKESFPAAEETRPCLVYLCKILPSCAPATWLPYGETRSSTRSHRRPTTQVPSCNTVSSTRVQNHQTPHPVPIS